MSDNVLNYSFQNKKTSMTISNNTTKGQRWAEPDLNKHLNASDTQLCATGTLKGGLCVMMQASMWFSLCLIIPNARGVTECTGPNGLFLKDVAVSFVHKGGPLYFCWLDRRHRWQQLFSLDTNYSELSRITLNVYRLKAHHLILLTQRCPSWFTPRRQHPFRT